MSASADLGLVVVVFDGEVSAKEFTLRVGPLIERPEIGLLPLALIDMTRATGTDGPSQVVVQHARVAAHYVDAKIGEGSKMALVATRDEFFGLARMYEMLREDSPVEVMVFRSVPEAERWLHLPDGYAEQLVDVIQEQDAPG